MTTSKRPQRRGKHRQSPLAAVGADQRLEALELRKAGLTFSAIGRALGGLSRQRAHQLVSEELARIAEERTDSAIALRDLELARLDRYLECLDAKIAEGDCKAVHEAVLIGDRRAKLLGLDAPEQRDVTVRADEVTPERARAVMAEFFGSQAAPKPNGQANGSNGHHHDPTGGTPAGAPTA